VFTIGDVYRAAPTSRILAVQKEGTDYIPGTFKFEDYDIFFRESSTPLPPITINTYSYQNNPIVVDDIEIIGISTAGVFQIGGIDHIVSKNWTKHFRLLQEDEQM
ncbi:spore germination protein GerPE, partial [Halobacillus sp. BBL2006]|uniref:spore germination protein GerPE n=1 Tax=Halobacillus sp. BBL2006 TaxID=1543706 RepID=UPI000541B055